MRLVQIIHRHVRFHTLAPGAYAVYGSTGVCPLLSALSGPACVLWVRCTLFSVVKYHAAYL
jgi:hypothetical protein